MIRLHSAPIASTIELLRQILAEQHIQTVVRGSSLNSSLGEVPFTETWSELWLVDGNEALARQIVADFVDANQPPTNDTPWTCARCGEQGEPGFALCWNCGAERAT